MNDIKIIDGDINVDTTIKDNIEILVEIDNTAGIDVAIETSDSEILVVLDNVIETSIEMDSSIHEVATTKHNELLNRNLPNQHTIEAITGLREELDQIKRNTTISYNDLTDKPKINDVELVGNKTHNDIKITALDEVDIGAILD